MNRILKVSALVFTTLLTHAALAQSDSSKVVTPSDSNKSSMKTIFGAKTKINYLGFYVSPEFMYGQINGGFTAGGGGALMVQVNQKWGVGFNVFSLGGRHDFAENGEIPKAPGATFSGLKVEYTLNPNKLFHVSFPLSFGVVGHGMKMGRFDRDDDRFERENEGRHGFGDRPQNDLSMNPMADTPQALDRPFDNQGKGAFFQPGVNLESNLFRYAKIYAGAKYRVALNNTGFNSDLSGFSANIGLKLGIFDIPMKKKTKISN